MTPQTTEKETFKEENIKTIFECWNEVINRFFQINGRTTRYEFWSFQTVSSFIFILAALIGLIFGHYKIVFELYALYFLVPFASSATRRLHDAGRSGYWVLPELILAPLVLICWEISVGFLILPVFLLLSYTTYLYTLLAEDGDLGANEYGEKIAEPRIYNQDSKVFIGFMVVVLSILWIIFLVALLF